MFSSRSGTDREPNALTRELRRLGPEGLLDLTQSNPTAAGIRYDADGILSALAQPAALSYQPAALGPLAAREAVSNLARDQGLALPAERVLLTASTSEAYAALFKLLCDPGDSVLVPTPSYPLFEHLTRLDNVQARPYGAEYHGAWQIDLEDLRYAITDTTRAVLVVSPNNPTGGWLKRDELKAIVELCATHHLALIGDEVFADYPIDPAPGAARSVVEQADVLSVSLGGLSKSIGLPQLKLGWMALNGPATVLQGALMRLELIADTYLSVSTPVQVA